MVESLFIMSTQWRLYSPVSFTPSCIHHSYRFFLKWVHGCCCCCQAKQSKAALASVCKYLVHFRCLHLLHTKYVQIQNPSQQLEGWKIKYSWVIFSRCESDKLRISLYKSLTSIFVEVNKYLVRLKLGI